MRDRSRGDRRLRFATPTLWIALAAVLAVSLLLILFVSRQLEIERRIEWLAELERGRAAAGEEQEQLRGLLVKGDDLERIEQLARERLGLVMPGEEKVIFIEEQP